MSMRRDPLEEQLQPPDRVHYATGLLLDAQDFQAEQTYHRGRLARALAYLHGYGTIAGLKVEWEGPMSDDEEIAVRPGIALDRLGRTIEVQRDACIRLNRWYQGQPVDDLIQGLHGAPFNGVVADVFVRFVVCERGKTPAFASGPFDALDAVVPSRLRDYYELELVIRKEADPPLPQSQWPPFAGIEEPASQRTATHNAILDAWRDGPDTWTNQGPAPLPEHAVGQETTSVFLARITIPATAGAPGERPTRAEGQAVQVDNDSRPFIYSSGVVASVLGLTT